MNLLRGSPEMSDGDTARKPQGRAAGCRLSSASGLVVLADPPLVPADAGTPPLPNCTDFGSGNSWVPASAGRTEEIPSRARGKSEPPALPPDRFLRLAEDLGRIGGKSCQHLLPLLAGSGIDIEPDLVGLGEEILVLHGCQQGLAQHLEAVGRNAGRAGEPAAEQELLEVHVEHGALEIVLGEV